MLTLRCTRRTFSAGLALASALAGTPALAQSTLERAKADGYIRVGFANEAPFGFATADGKLTGEAPEVANAVLAKMSITEVDGVLTEFGSLIPGLKAGGTPEHVALVEPFGFGADYLPNLTTAELCAG